MTKKDYVLFANWIADRIRAQRLVGHAHCMSGPAQCICAGLADLFAKENPRFDRGRFLSACIPEEEVCEKFKPQARGDAWYCQTCHKPQREHSGPPSRPSAQSTPRHSRRK